MCEMRGEMCVFACPGHDDDDDQVEAGHGLYSMMHFSRPRLAWPPQVPAHQIRHRHARGRSAQYSTIRLPFVQARVLP